MRGGSVADGVGFPWRTAVPIDDSFPEDVVRLSVVEAAPALLGCVLESIVGGERVSGVIVETEAYGGPEDPASHAATVSGPTERNRVMYGPPGRAYVYRSYGVHWCVNVVTAHEGIAEAVLIRGLEPLQGQDVMSRRRGAVRPLTAGPGRLSAALAIGSDLNGHDLRAAPLLLRSGWTVAAERVGRSRRVGVTKAADWPLRFFVRGARGVSRPEGWGAEVRVPGP